MDIVLHLNNEDVLSLLPNGIECSDVSNPQNKILNKENLSRPEFVALLLHSHIRHNSGIAFEGIEKNGFIFSQLHKDVQSTIIDGFFENISLGKLPNAQLLAHIIQVYDLNTVYIALMNMFRKIDVNSEVAIWISRAIEIVNPSHVLCLLPEEYPYANRHVINDMFPKATWCNPFAIKKVDIYTNIHECTQWPDGLSSPVQLVSQEDAYMNLSSLGIDDNFPWDNLVIAGGAPSLCLNSNFSDHATEVDIDIWITKDFDVTLQNLIKWSHNKGYRKIDFQTGLLNIVGDNLPTIQIVKEKGSDIINIHQLFDMSSSQVFLVDNTFYCSPHFALYAPHGISIIRIVNICITRIYKAIIRGWRVCMAKSCYIDVQLNTNSRFDHVVIDDKKILRCECPSRMSDDEVSSLKHKEWLYETRSSNFNITENGVYAGNLRAHRIHTQNNIHDITEDVTRLLDYWKDEVKTLSYSEVFEEEYPVDYVNCTIRIINDEKSIRVVGSSTKCNTYKDHCLYDNEKNKIKEIKRYKCIDLKGRWVDLNEDNTYNIKRFPESHKKYAYLFTCAPNKVKTIRRLLGYF